MPDSKVTRVPQALLRREAKREESMSVFSEAIVMMAGWTDDRTRVSRYSGTGLRAGRDDDITRAIVCLMTASTGLFVMCEKASKLMHTHSEQALVARSAGLSCRRSEVCGRGSPLEKALSISTHALSHHLSSHLPAIVFVLVEDTVRFERESFLLQYSTARHCCRWLGDRECPGHGDDDRMSRRARHAAKTDWV